MGSPSSRQASISARADPSALSLCHAINTPVSLSEKAMDIKSFFGFPIYMRLGTSIAMTIYREKERPSECHEDRDSNSDCFAAAGNRVDDSCGDSRFRASACCDSYRVVLRRIQGGKRNFSLTLKVSPKKRMKREENVGDIRKSRMAISAAVAVEMPIGLNHLDTDFCWCDPIVEIDDNGRKIVLHRQVTWN